MHSNSWWWKGLYSCKIFTTRKYNRSLRRKRSCTIISSSIQNVDFVHFFKPDCLVNKIFTWRITHEAHWYQSRQKEEFRIAYWLVWFHIMLSRSIPIVVGILACSISIWCLFLGIIIPSVFENLKATGKKQYTSCLFLNWVFSRTSRITATIVKIIAKLWK